SSSDASSSDAASADAGACSPACGLGRLCCGGVCVNPDNDPGNCGACGRTCSGATPFCDGTCRAAPCSLADDACGAVGGSCCGSSCCAAGSICCKTEGPLATPPVCFTPSDAQKTCPQGCAPMCVSDRNLKRDVSPADERAVLEAVGRMPVSTWSYTTDGARVRHIGPMAQDFHSAFGVGVTDQAYDPVDAHGVELASIKALYAIVQEQSARIDRLERENRALRGRSTPAASAKPAARRP
ncbi:MAG TPA: tail fiber domain-containing protein, partial [Polyangiaceae bacterium]|nr:tail fiber domain-containing protein [Polyangiaceae bacterium]